MESNSFNFERQTPPHLPHSGLVHFLPLLNAFTLQIVIVHSSRYSIVKVDLFLLLFTCIS